MHGRTDIVKGARLGQSEIKPDTFQAAHQVDSSENGVDHGLVPGHVRRERLQGRVDPEHLRF